jgi:hypothetical protein
MQDTRVTPLNKQPRSMAQSTAGRRLIGQNLMGDICA